PELGDLVGGERHNHPPWLPERHMDLAASVQFVLEEALLRMARAVKIETGAKNLCLAGGVALNCVANGKLLHERIFERLWIQPAAGDAGGALGAALAVHYIFKDQLRQVNPCSDQMNGAYLGPSFTQEEIERKLAASGATFQVLNDEALLETCVDA